MNEELPFPAQPPLPPTPASVPPPPDPPAGPPFWLMVVLGVLMLILSCFLCAGAQSLTPFLCAALGAFASLFFKGWRGLFVGFAGTIGVALLVLIVICGSQLQHL